MKRARGCYQRLGLALLLLVALAFEDAWPGWSLWGWRPAPLIYFTALSGFFYAPWQAALLGALAGLLQDLLTSRLLGLHLLCQALTAYGVAWLLSRLYRAGLNTAICVVALATLLESSLYGLLGYPWGLRGQFAHLPQQMLANMLLTPLIYLAIRRRIPRDEAPPEAVRPATAARATQPQPLREPLLETAREFYPGASPEEETPPC